MYTNLGKNKKALWCFYSFFAQYPNFRMVNIHIDFCRLNPFWWLFRPSFSVPSCHKSYSATNWCLVPGAAEAWSTAVFEKHEKRPMERTTHQAFIVVLSWFYIVVVAIWNGDVLESCWFTRGRVSPMVSLKWSSKDFWWIFMMENPPRNGYLPFSLEPTNQWPWTMDLFWLEVPTMLLGRFFGALLRNIPGKYGRSCSSLYEYLKNLRPENLSDWNPSVTAVPILSIFKTLRHGSGKINPNAFW